MKKEEIEQLKRENQALRAYALDLHWMARRYVDYRSSYAPSLFNRITRGLLELEIKLNPTADGTIWARDGMGRRYDGLADDPFWEGSPATHRGSEGMIAAVENEIAVLNAENGQLREKLAALEGQDA